MTARITIPLVVAEWFPILLGLLLLFAPTYLDLGLGIWRSQDQAHAPIVASVAIWFFWRQRQAIHASDPVPSKAGWPLFIAGLALYVVGRSQSIISAEVGSQILVILGVLLIQRGWSGIRHAWLPLFFMLFMIPLPSAFVDSLTMPMKLSVSYLAEHILYAFGYPMARTGVILQIGQYQLLVADACAGLNTLFSLEALGLLYLNLVRYQSVLRNVGLALLIIPISFSANVIRVIALTLITYYFGDAAGQGFMHWFAGMVLFISALLLIIAADTLLRSWQKRRTSRGTADSSWPGVERINRRSNI